MVNFRLQLVNRQNVANIIDLNLPSVEGIPIQITFQVADIRNPDKREGSKSGTINIQGTKDVNIFFEHAYDANIDLLTWDPNKKIDAYYFKKEVKQYEGRLQLLKMTVNQETKIVNYECNIVGKQVGLFTAINNKLLTDINWAYYYPTTHTINAASVANSWALGSGAGNVIYPFIDWGTNNSNMNFVSPHHLRGCLFLWDYFYRIFTDAGYKWTSTFLDSTFFKKLIIPPTEIPALSETVMANNKFRAHATGVQGISKSMTFNTGLLILTETTYTTIAFQAEDYDAANIFVTPTFTPTTTNQYNTTANIGLNLVVTRNAVDDSANITDNGSYITVTISNATNILGSAQLTNLNFAPGNVNNVSIPLNGQTLTAGQQLKVSVQYSLVDLITTSAAGTYLLLSTIVSGSNFASEFSSSLVYEGATYSPNDLIPPIWKQSELVSSIIRMFNLYVQVDPTNEKNLIIEPRETFYLTTAKDWTLKKDWSKQRTVIPMSELDSLKFKYQYKNDGDYFNKLFTDEYHEPYGSDYLLVNNDFVKGEKNIEVIFSPTPYAVNPNLPAVIPQILTKTNGVVTPFKPNIRILYWGGSVALPTGQWTLKNGTSAYGVYSTIPAAGHTDNPYAPTLDLNWGFPKRIYAPAGILPTNWTNNNLRNKYYSRFESQITDKDSKIVIDYFVLTENDVNTIDFRYPIFVDDTYYLLNKIPDFDPTVDGSIPVELLKLTNFDPFVPVSVDITGGVFGNNMGNQ